MLESHGVRLAAVSYDAIEKLAHFARQHHIEFPLLSDHDSAVIRSFGIFNTNIAPGLRAHGVPHPVEYLVSPQGVVIHKYFVPNYQHRVAASAVALREFGAVDPNTPRVTLQSRPVSVEIALSSATAFAGQEIGFLARFALEPGWHLYTDTAVDFDESKVARQSLQLPPPVDETHPVYTNSFQGVGSLLLRFPLPEGAMRLSGEVRFQPCSETVCEPPVSIPFELPLTLERFLGSTALG
jgi:hypothetical protein